MPLNPASSAQLPPLNSGAPADRVLSQALFASKLSDKDPWPPWSTGEILAVALVLNRHDVLTSMGYTIVEALHRVEFDVVDLLPELESKVAALRA